MAHGICVAVGVTLLLLAGDANAQRPSESVPAGQSQPQTFSPGPLAMPAGPLGASWLFGEDLGSNDNSSTLFQLDVASGAVAARGETGLANVTDVAFHRDGRLFGVTFTHLLELNPRTGATRIIGSGIGFSGVNALVAASDGLLYAATTSSLFQSGGDFLRLDPTTGRGTRIGRFGGGLESSGDLAFAPDGTLYGTADNGSLPDLLIRVDISTGQATIIGSVGFVDVFGLAFGPDGLFYGVARGGPFSTPTLIRINRFTGAGTTIATIPTAYGMGGLAARVGLSPVEGLLRMTGAENPDCLNVPNVWTFCQHRTGFHRAGGGVQGSDDTYAWDVNLMDNRDRGKPVFAVAAGRVVKYAGVVPTVGNNSGAVLIEHSIDGSPCDVIPEKCWWSGYLHLRDIQVTENDSVGPNTRLGFVGNTSPFPIPDHLHLVFYEGANRPGELRSVDSVFHPRLKARLGDFDGDGQTDITVYRPSNGTWYVLTSNSGFVGGAGYVWGVSTDVPVPGDYDGDGRIDVAVYRPSTGHWFILKSSTNYATSSTYQWGTTGDIPVAGDYDGDGKTDIAVYRPSNGTWYILTSSTGFTGGAGYAWGVGSDVPVPGDYDGDGKIDVAVYRPSTAHWFILKSSTNYTTWGTYQWGSTGDIPVLRRQ